jgi:hypothetical protein
MELPQRVLLAVEAAGVVAVDAELKTRHQPDLFLVSPMASRT